MTTELVETRDLPELIVDPVSHISISGVHGRDELAERLAHAPAYRAQRSSPITTLVLGAAIGATLMYLFKR